MSDFYTVERISLSRIGKLLRDRLGDDVDNYVFPDDFEKAVNDIDFKAIVFLGDSSPFDAVVIGNVSVPAMFMHRTDAGGSSIIKSVSFIGIGQDQSYIVSNDFCRSNLALTSVTLPVNTVQISGYAFTNCQVLEEINNLDNVTIISNSFGSIYNMETINLPSVTTINTDHAFSSSRFKNIYMPKCTSFRNNTFNSCTYLEYVQLGSIGNAVTNVTGGATNGAFYGCTQGNFIIDCYAKDTYIDTAITNIRNCATNATIVIKAPSDLTYNGIDYEAGDTVITSNP